MKAIEKTIELMDEMVHETNKIETKNNSDFIMKQSILAILLGIKMKTYQFYSEELKENNPIFNNSKKNLTNKNKNNGIK